MFCTGLPVSTKLQYCSGLASMVLRTMRAALRANLSGCSYSTASSILRGRQCRTMKVQWVSTVKRVCVCGAAQIDLSKSHKIDIKDKTWEGKTQHFCSDLVQHSIPFQLQKYSGMKFVMEYNKWKAILNQKSQMSCLERDWLECFFFPKCLFQYSFLNDHSNRINMSLQSSLWAPNLHFSLKDD